MPNPFESEFSKNPYTNQQLINVAKQKAAAQQAAEERAAQEEHKRARDQKIYEALRNYSDMVLEVLEQLKDTYYPHLMVKSGKDGSGFSDNFIELKPDHYWQLGAVRDYFMYGSQRKTFYPTISIGMSTTETGDATSFVCRHNNHWIVDEELSSNDDSWTRIRVAQLTREDLIRALVELHQPNPILQEIANRDKQVQTALELFLDSPTLIKMSKNLQKKAKQKARQDYSTFTPNDDTMLSITKSEVASLSDTSRLTDHIEASAKDGDLWNIRSMIGYSAGNDRIAHDLVGVRLRFNDQGVATHYVCYIYFTKDGKQIPEAGQAHLVELSTASLAKKILEMIAEINGDGGQKKQGGKRWFGF